YKIEGVATTLAFGKFVCEHEAFTSGDFDTHFVKNHYSPESLAEQYAEERKIAALVGLRLHLENQKILRKPITVPSLWKKSRTR
ncbi:MAG: biotin carboxylase, partial [Flavobacteriaceae bacterium]